METRLDFLSRPPRPLSLLDDLDPDDGSDTETLLLPPVRRRAPPGTDLTAFMERADARAARQNEAICKLVESTTACMAEMQRCLAGFNDRLDRLEFRFDALPASLSALPAPPLLSLPAPGTGTDAGAVAVATHRFDDDDERNELRESAAKIEALNGVRILRFLWQFDAAGGAATYGGDIMIADPKDDDRTIVSRSLLKELFSEIGGACPARVTWDLVDHTLFWVADPETRPRLQKAPLSSSRSFYEDRDLSRDRFLLRTDGPNFVRHPRVFACSTRRLRWFWTHFGVSDAAPIAARLEDVPRAPRPFNSVRAGGAWNWSAPFYAFEADFETGLEAPWHVCFGEDVAKARRGVGVVPVTAGRKRPAPPSEAPPTAPALRTGAVGVVHDDGSVTY